MGLRTFTDDPDLAERFVEFAEDLYAGDMTWIPPIHDEQVREVMSCEYAKNQTGSAYRHFIARAGNRTLGRLSAFINPKLKDAQGRCVATLGNFECIEDANVCAELLQAAEEWIRTASDCTTMWGPMNYDIWHGYRFMTKGFDRKPFCSEPYNKPYYPCMFEQNGYRVLDLEFSGAKRP